MNSFSDLHKNSLASFIELGTLDNHFISNGLLYPNVDNPENIISSMRAVSVFLSLVKYAIASLYCLSSNSSLGITPVFGLCVLLSTTVKIIFPLSTAKYNVLIAKIVCGSILSKDKQ